MTKGQGMFQSCNLSKLLVEDLYIYIYMSIEPNGIGPHMLHVVGLSLLLQLGVQEVGDYYGSVSRWAPSWLIYHVSNPGTTPITILAINSDHGLSFAGEEARTMV